MSIELNHTIVNAHDQPATAAFITAILGLPDAKSFADGHFLMIELDNGVTLDVMSTDRDFTRQHYAFVVGDDEFDEIFERVKERGVTYWADPVHTREGEINHMNGGRGFYFTDPNLHNLEVLTRV